MEEETLLPRLSKEAEVRRVLEEILADQALDDQALRAKIEALAGCRSFSGLTWFWGPILYRRNRVLFRPVILRNFSAYSYRGKLLSWKRVAWRGEVKKQGEEWMNLCETALDMELFDRLWHWRSGGTTSPFQSRDKMYRGKLETSFSVAKSASERLEVLNRFRISFSLDEATACKLYEEDYQVAGPFLKERLPFPWGERRALWKNLFALAVQRDDEKLASEVYRRTVDPARWREDALRLCDRHREPPELVAELKNIHPRGTIKNAAEVYLQLIEARGRDVLPYIIPNLSSIRFRVFSYGKDHKRLLTLAEENQWWDLWTALVRVLGSHREYEKAIQHLLQRPESDARQRLAMLAGVSREFHWSGFSAVSVVPLSDETALALYRRFPDLLRRAFRPQLGGTRRHKRPSFLPKLIEAGEEDLIDYIASRWVTRPHYGKHEKVQVDLLADYYSALKSDPILFARRACAVLTQVPAFSIWSYNWTIKENRLARLLFERSPREFLASKEGLVDLVEAPEIHVMSLAYRVLGLDDSRAREAAERNLEVLLGVFFRPVQRRTRLTAFKALLNAAGSIENAERIHRKAREALDLPDKFYPKEQLVGLIGQLLHRWPSLRAPGESPIVYTAA